MDDKDLYRWRGDADQLENYPYIVDDNDISAFNAYARCGRLPPKRPTGFLDDDEKEWWESWKYRHKKD